MKRYLIAMWFFGYQVTLIWKYETFEIKFSLQNASKEPNFAKCTDFCVSNVSVIQIK